MPSSRDVLRWSSLALIASTAACVLGKPSSCAPDRSAPSTFARVDDALERALARVSFHARKADENLSDGTMLDERTLVVVSDEGTELALVDVSTGESNVVDLTKLDPTLSAALGDARELDLEGVASFGRTLFVTGSASLKRKKPKRGEDNAARLAQVEEASGDEAAGAHYVLALAASGTGAATSLSLRHFFDLRKALLSSPLLAPFADVPSKDNGLDVEGLAADASTLYVGLRGPVLRGHALVARLTHTGEDLGLSFLQLRGLGIRSLAMQPAGGLWVLAGPTMELDAPFSLWRWDGASSVFEGEASQGLSEIVALPHDDGSSPEGVLVRGKDVCLLFDGPRAGSPRCEPVARLAR